MPTRQLIPVHLDTVKRRALSLLSERRKSHRREAVDASRKLGERIDSAAKAAELDTLTRIVRAMREDGGEWQAVSCGKWRRWSPN